MMKIMDPYEELASMFVTGPGGDHAHAQRESSTQGAAPRATVELLIVGHLPVRAGLWLIPYADMAAREVGPTTLLRLDHEQPTMHLLRGDEPATISSTATLRQAMTAFAGLSRRWIICAGAGASLVEVLRAQPDRITILSSADDAAVVAAYQIVKNLHAASESSETQLPAIALAAVGADEHSAQRLHDRVHRTTTSFLGVGVELAMTLHRMDTSIRSTGHATFPAVEMPGVVQAAQWIEEANAEAAQLHAQQMRRIEQAPLPAAHADERLEERGYEPPVIETPRPAQPQHHAPMVSPAETASLCAPLEGRTLDEGQRESPMAPVPPVPQSYDASFTVRGTSARDAGVRPTFDDVQFAQPPLTDVIRGDAAAHARSGAPYGHGRGSQVEGESFRFPHPGAAIEPKEPARGNEPDDHGRPVLLARYVQGLQPIELRCPERERIELAVDAKGGLHLLGRESELRDMHFVERWLRTHRELIALVQPQLQLNPRQRPICHVFTDEPAKVRDLHGSDLRLHVLTPVEVAGKRGWYAAPLN